MKTRDLVLIGGILLTNFLFRPTAEARLFTARLMATDEETLAQAQSRETDSILPPDMDGQLTFESAARLAELADNYRKRGLYSYAEVIFKDLAAMRQSVIGADNPEIAGYLTNLADIYCAKKDYAGAEQLYIQTLDIREKSLGLRHRDVATSLRKLADLYRAQDRYQEALPLYARALAILEEVVRPEDSDLAAVRASYTALLAASARSVVKVREPEMNTGGR